MELHEQLSLALMRCGYPPLAGATAYRQIGAGAWHDAYLVYPRGAAPLVVRLRKQVIERAPWPGDDRRLPVNTLGTSETLEQRDAR